MLKETYVSQKEEKSFRRWFEDDYFSLIVWYSKKDNTISGFQLCYNKKWDEHVFTWHKRDGFMHNKLDKSRRGSSPATPILVDNGIFPIGDVMNRLKSSVDLLDEDIRKIIFDKLIEYSESQY